MEIRKVRICDWDTLESYFIESWKEWLSNDESRTKLSLEYVRDKVRNNTVLGCYDGELMIGYLVYSYFWNSLHMDDLYICASYRRKGIAIDFLKSAITIGMERGCETINSDCDIDNIPSVKLHEKMGFKIAGYSKIFDVDCYLYKYKL